MRRKWGKKGQDCEEVEKLRRCGAGRHQAMNRTAKVMRVINKGRAIWNWNVVDALYRHFLSLTVTSSQALSVHIWMQSSQFEMKQECR